MKLPTPTDPQIKVAIAMDGLEEVSSTMKGSLTPCACVCLCVSVCECVCVYKYLHRVKYQRVDIYSSNISHREHAPTSPLLPTAQTRSSSFSLSACM